MFTYHEAGHAVMAHLQHRRIKPLTVGKINGASKRLTAHLQGEWSHSSDRRDQIEREILTLFGGQIAQNLFTGRRGGRGADYHQAKVLAILVASEEKERTAYLNWLWLRAQNLINDLPNPAAVQTLAETLRSEPEVRGIRTIPARQVKAIIEGALRD